MIIGGFAFDSTEIPLTLIYILKIYIIEYDDKDNLCRYKISLYILIIRLPKTYKLC